MLKKFICFSIILIFSVSLLNITYATNADLMTIDNANTLDTNVIDGNINNVIDETTIDNDNDYEDAATITTTDYESETELSISNMINIVLIVVGIVLILLGIAIIIKLK